MWENKVTSSKQAVKKTSEEKQTKAEEEKKPHFVMPRKLKKIITIFCVILIVSCLFAGIVSNFNFKKLNVEGFNGELLNISSSSQALAQQEINKIVLLNTGNKNAKATFTVREKKDGEYVYQADNETKQGYASFYIDSEDLQLSLLVQTQWAIGFFTEEAGGTPARVSCAEKEHSKYPESTCVDIISDSYLWGTNVLDNFALLKAEKYGSMNETNLLVLRETLKNYLKKFENNLDSILIAPRSIVKNGNNVSAIIETNNEKSYQLVIENVDKEITIVLKSDDSELLHYDSSKIKTASRHFLLLKNYLPAEIELDDGTAIAIRFAGGKKLNANVENCALEKDAGMTKKHINEWIKLQGFNPEDFEINVIKHCEK